VNGGQFLAGVAGGADDQVFASGGAGRGQFGSEAVVAEIDDGIAGGEGRGESVAGIDLGGDDDFRIGGGCGQHGQTHASAATGDKKI
jgi:hypothetical protein